MADMPKVTLLFAAFLKRFLVIAKNESQFGNTFGLFAMLAIFVACLGFLKLVLIANVIAIPIVRVVMDKWWLNGFVFRIDVGPMFFVIAGALSIAFALITVSYQAAISAAITNPVESLRYE